MLLEILVQLSFGVHDKPNLRSLGVGRGYCFNLQDSLAQNILNQIPANAKNLIKLDSLAGAHVVVLADCDGVQRPTYKDLGFVFFPATRKDKYINIALLHFPNHKKYHIDSVLHPGVYKDDPHFPQSIEGHCHQHGVASAPMRCNSRQDTLRVLYV